MFCLTVKKERALTNLVMLSDRGDYKELQRFCQVKLFTYTVCICAFSCLALNSVAAKENRIYMHPGPITLN